MCTGDKIRIWAIEEVMEKAESHVFLTIEGLSKNLLDKCPDMDENQIADILREYQKLFFIVSSSGEERIHPLPKALDTFLSLRGIRIGENDFEYRIPEDRGEYAKHMAEYAFQEVLNNAEIIQLFIDESGKVCLQMRVRDDEIRESFSSNEKVNINIEGGMVKFDATRLKYIAEVIMK